MHIKLLNLMKYSAVLLHFVTKKFNSLTARVSSAMLIMEFNIANSNFKAKIS